MTEQEAIRIISDGHWDKHEILHAARFILGVMRERERVYARLEQVNHELIKERGTPNAGSTAWTRRNRNTGV